MTMDYRAAGGNFLRNQLVDKLAGGTESAKHKITAAFMMPLQQTQQMEEVSCARQNLAYKDTQDAPPRYRNKLKHETRNYVKNMFSKAISRVLADYLTAGVAKDCLITIY
jgi:type III secretory pathway component EscR